MIKEEIITINGKQFVKHTTDKERFDENQEPLPSLVQIETGKLYFDAIDNYPSKYHYEEYEEEEIVAW